MTTNDNTLHQYITEREATERLTLLTGKPYINAASTDISETFRKMGWLAPSEKRKLDEAKAQYEADIATLEQENRQMRARMERLEKENTEMARVINERSDLK